MSHLLDKPFDCTVCARPVAKTRNGMCYRCSEGEAPPHPTLCSRCALDRATANGKCARCNRNQGGTK